MDGSDVRPWKRLEGRVVGNFLVLVPVFLSVQLILLEKQVEGREDEKEERKEVRRELE